MTVGLSSASVFNSSDETGWPSTKNVFARGVSNLTAPFVSTNEPACPDTFSFRRTISFVGSLPSLFTPSFNQNRPINVNQPLSLVSSASLCARHCSISFACAAALICFGVLAHAVSSIAAQIPGNNARVQSSDLVCRIFIFESTGKY